MGAPFLEKLLQGPGTTLGCGLAGVLDMDTAQAPGRLCSGAGRSSSMRAAAKLTPRQPGPRKGSNVATQQRKPVTSSHSICSRPGGQPAATGEQVGGGTPKSYMA